MLYFLFLFPFHSLSLFCSLIFASTPLYYSLLSSLWTKIPFCVLCCRLSILVAVVRHIIYAKPSHSNNFRCQFWLPLLQSFRQMSSQANIVFTFIRNSIRKNLIISHIYWIRLSNRFGRRAEGVFSNLSLYIFVLKFDWCGVSGRSVFTNKLEMKCLSSYICTFPYLNFNWMLRVGVSDLNRMLWPYVKILIFFLWKMCWWMNFCNKRDKMDAKKTRPFILRRWKWAARARQQ